MAVLTAGSQEESRTSLVYWISDPAPSANDELAPDSLDTRDVTLELVSRSFPARDESIELIRRSESLEYHLRQENGGGSSDNKSLTHWNCSKLYDSSYGYNSSSCKFVRENCQSKAHLMNYLAFMKCDLPSSATVC